MKLAHHIARRFGTQAVNIRISDKDPITHQKIDNHLDRYGHLIRTFVLKRRMLRSEIWPKIHIIDNEGQQAHHLSYQRLTTSKKSMKQSMMMAIAKNDPSQINSSFIISTFCEDYFKEMIDQYVGKVLVSGKAPADDQKYKKIQDKVKELYWIFYFGEKNTPLQRQIEQIYLSSKQFKYRNSEMQKNANKKFIDIVTWIQRDQRVLQQKLNWTPAQTNMTDINYRTYFQPLNYHNRLLPRLKSQELRGNNSYLDKLAFRWFTSKSYDQKSSKYYQWVQQKVFVRIMNHIRSLEFTTCMNIPHDYLIEAQMVQIHFWLVVDRLKKIGTLRSKVLSKLLNINLNTQIIKGARSVNLKKSNVLIASLERMLESNSTILDLHFNISDLTKTNPYLGIDALVWSIAFAQKTHRYSDEVYLFADYLVQNFIHMQHHTEEQLLDGIIQFDPYLVSTNYRQKIQKVNPPLSAAQFQKQFSSNSNEKDYYYSKIQRKIEENMDFQRYRPKEVNTSFSFSQLLQPIRQIRVKYFNLKTMDHFNKLQQAKKNNQQLDKKQTWKTQSDQVKKIHQDFNSINHIKNERRKNNQQQLHQKKS